MSGAKIYVLEEQIGFLLRRATQRHLAIFSDAIPEVTTTQFAVLVRLSQMGPMSQNLLGREAAMDAATVKGVVDRLAREGLLTTTPDPDDRRRLVVQLTAEGAALLARRLPQALAISQRTLAPLDARERRELLRLLARIAT